MTWHIRTNINRGGQPYSQTKTAKVHGSILGSGQDDLTTKENALKTALASNFQNLILLNDDSTQSSEVLLNNTSITGVKIIDGPHFNVTMGAEYATLRTFDFTAEAEYPLANTASLLLDWTETLSFSGGGPVYAHLLAINGPPQKQLIYPASIYSCRQTGSAVGYLAYPSPAAQKFPYALKQNPDIHQKSPTRKGNGYEGFETTWAYIFESAGPLVATPTLWIS